MKKVSIIVPVYNAQDTIKKCVDSIIGQTYKNIELLLINDGSKDNSLSLLNEYEKKYNFIKVIDQENCGVAKTRNKAINIATGEYVMFIDNDDYIEIDYVETYVNNIKKYDVDVVIGGYKRITEENKIIKKEQLKEKIFSKYVVMAPWAKIYKRNFLLKNDIKFLACKIGEDVYFNLDVYFKTDKIKIIDYCGYYWFFNTKSVSNTKQQKIDKNIDILYLLNKIVKLKDYQSNDITDYYFTRYYIWYLLFSGRNSTSDIFLNEYYRIKNWFNEHKINTKVSAFSKKVEGDSLKNKLIVTFFRFMEKMKLIKLFSKIYCRG